MIKLKNLLKECGDCQRDWNGGHDHEASMAKNELRDLVSNASKVDNLVQDQDNLPGWVSAYITLAADYMHSVAEYLGGEAAQMGANQEPTPGYAIYEGEGLTDPKEIINAITVEYPMKDYSRQLLAFMKDKQHLQKIANGEEPTEVFSNYLKTN
jgi:hypothetical protein